MRREGDAAIARAAIDVAAARLKRIDAEIDRRIVRAPAAGRVLKIGVRPGGLATDAPGAPPVLLMGDDERLVVRAAIDEYDAWRVRAELPATVRLPGNRALSAPVRFERVEPYVQPKASLAGGALERTDTRVLEVVYSLAPGALPVWIGQQVEVEIGGAAPIAGGAGAGATAAAPAAVAAGAGATAAAPPR